jgi:hypothetical protein
MAPECPGGNFCERLVTDLHRLGDNGKAYIFEKVAAIGVWFMHASRLSASSIPLAGC